MEGGTRPEAEAAVRAKRQRKDAKLAHRRRFGEPLRAGPATPCASFLASFNRVVDSRGEGAIMSDAAKKLEGQLRCMRVCTNKCASSATGRAARLPQKGGATDSHRASPQVGERCEHIA